MSTENLAQSTGDAVGGLLNADGRSNWYKGVQLIVIYLIIAILYFYMPG